MSYASQSMRAGCLLVSFFVVNLLILKMPGYAQRDEMPAGYPYSLESTLQELLEHVKKEGPSSALLTKLAETYFDLADDLLTDDVARRTTYEMGANMAKQAFQLNDANADAHFFYAINLGSAERLKGMTSAALVLSDIRHCLERAIALNPAHAQALQMMGGLLLELPWFLGGDEKKAQAYLEQAIRADGNFMHARILAAKLYRKQGRQRDAVQQLLAVIQADRPHYAYTWERKYKPEAERLLQELERSPAP
ncbi:exported protein of unknown function [Nitrospira sp. KM1]|uniref:hypothetical protein n=1 Tax=Nitrospira sp. KM1 TaxID=1936990 RepID=UPI0013A74647|nr:hypothetical protein [Nitrospira sp. KM1]BCA52884.1 exported protein of unknown function [Nitrospira sp. KM1]